MFTKGKKVVLVESSSQQVKPRTCVGYTSISWFRL